MAKIFSALTLIIAAIAAYLGFESQKLVASLQTTGEKTYNELVSTRTTLANTKKKLEETEKERDAEKSDKEKALADLAKANEDLKTANAELATAKMAKDTAEMALADIRTKIKNALPPGIDIDDIGKLATAITEMTNKVKELEAAVTSLTDDKAKLTARVSTLEGDVKRYDEKATVDRGVIDKYKKGIMVKSTRGRVLAVNAGWGFCVTTLGDKQGGANGKILIVVRGGQAIGRVKISNVEATQSIADIIPGSFARNTYVQPGDDVIFTGEDKVNVDEPADAGGAAPVPALPERGGN